VNKFNEMDALLITEDKELVKIWFAKVKDISPMKPNGKEICPVNIELWLSAWRPIEHVTKMLEKRGYNGQEIADYYASLAVNQ
jgi:hypothetical protein